MEIAQTAAHTNVVIPDTILPNDETIH